MRLNRELKKCKNCETENAFISFRLEFGEEEKNGR